MLHTSSEHKLHEDSKVNCNLLGFNLRSSHWEPTVITPRQQSGNITVVLKFYIPMQKVLQ